MLGNVCRINGCPATTAVSFADCVAHLSEQDLVSYLEHIGSGAVIELTRTTIDGELMDRLIGAAPLDVAGTPTLKVVARGATFQTSLNFRGHRFQIADFSRVTFKQSVVFSNAQFDEARFGRARFDRTAEFASTRFAGDAIFGSSRFHGHAEFRSARFGSQAVFTDAHFAAVARFTAAAFAGPARFVDTRFYGEASFASARMHGGALFDRATFAKGAVFARARIAEQASFRDCEFAAASFNHVEVERLCMRAAKFTGNADFHDIVVVAAADLHSISFRGWASFATARVGGRLNLRGCMFEDAVGLTGAHVQGTLDLSEATFRAGVLTSRLHCESDFLLVGASFEATTRIGPCLVLGEVSMDRASFGRGVIAVLSAARVNCRRATFEQDTDLRIRWADVLLDGSAFLAPALIGGPPRSFDPGKAVLGGEEEALRERCTSALRPSPRIKPRLLSLRGVAVDQMTLAYVDLEACRFVGAHRLDKLRIEANCDFAQAPGRFGTARRQTVAEEHEWRVRHGSQRGTFMRARAARWSTPETRRPPLAFLGVADQPEPTEISSVYRLLRKAREDNKDEPGAADFYYGEMEMRRNGISWRRRSRAGSWGEKLVLTLYWLVSGYGLRASRALVALAICCAVGAWGLHTAAPGSSVSFYQGIVRSIESVTSVLRPLPAHQGEATQLIAIGLRVLGSGLIAMAVLAVRARVRR